MKRYSNLNNEELTQLTDSDIQTLIDIEIAYAGIIPVFVPDPPPAYKVPFKPTEIAYEIYGVLFTDFDDALAFSKMSIVSSNYDWNKAGSDYKWLEPKSTYDSGIKTREFYRKADIDSIIQELYNYKRVKEAYEEASKEYNTFVERISDLRNAVYDAIREAKIYLAEISAAKALYQKYITLADGDETIALSFIKDAYKERQDIIDAITVKEVEELDI